MSNETIVNNEEEKGREEKIELLRRKISDITALMYHGGNTKRAVGEVLNSENVIQLEGKADELRRQEKRLSSTVTPMEVYEAQVRRFDREAENILADGDIPRAKEVEGKKFQLLEDRKKLLTDIQNLNSQVGAVEEEIKGLLRPAFFAAIGDIKAELGRQLALTLAFKDMELLEFVTLQEKHGIRLPFSPSSEIKIYPENVYHGIRERLQNELLP